MPFLAPFEAPYSIHVTKRLGRPNGCGLAWSGWSQCGEYNDAAGVFQQRHRRLAYWTKGNTPKGRKSNFKMRHTWPINPQTVPQQAWRSTFSSGVAAWHDLTSSEKLYYNNLGSRKGKTGFCIFMSQYLKSH